MDQRKRRKVSSKLAGVLILFLVLWIGGTLCAASSLTAKIPLLADLRTSLLANYATDFLNDTWASLRLTFLGDSSAGPNPEDPEIALNPPIPTIGLPQPAFTSTPSTVDSTEVPTTLPTNSPAQSPTPSPTPMATFTQIPGTTIYPTDAPTNTPTPVPTEISDPPPTPLDTPMPTPSASIKYEGSKSGGSTESNSVTTSGNVPAVEGQFYLTAVSTKPYHANVTSVSGLGLTWIHLRGQCAGRHQTGVDLWIAQGTPAFDGPVTASLAEETHSAVITVTRYSGVDLDHPTGAVKSANTNGISGDCYGGSDEDHYSFNLPISTDGAMAFAAIAHRQREHSPGGGFVERSEVKEGHRRESTSSLSIMDRIATPTSIKVKGYISDCVDWAVIAVELLPAP